MREAVTLRRLVSFNPGGCLSGVFHFRIAKRVVLPYEIQGI